MKEPLHITDDLLISYLLQEVSDEQVRQVTEWRAMDTANERRFEQFRLIWDSSKNFKADPDIDAHASLQRVKQKATRQAKVVPLISQYPWLKIAAAILLFAGGCWLFLNKFVNPQVRFETQGIVKTDTLSDGSTVTMNKYALLNYPKKFSAQQRNVSLVKGEAFFTVTPNKAKPFIIAAGNTTIKVVGTSFNVKNNNGIIEVIVETGIVQVTNNRNRVMITLKPGEMALLNPTTGKFTQIKIPDNLYSYYRSKEFVAKNVPLAKLVQVLNDVYDSHISIDTEVASKHLTLTGVLRTSDPIDVILNVLCITLKLRVEKNHDQIILKKADDSYYR
ncbi:FecR family protein [Mucilaginibacter sp. SP1R1]|uniref:FecR family protein n=1 Tax=Mucilaginibacter sp. SP1R1 TaxID=2723091 RepID=UPI001607DC3E|nr:FecR domain-containing protein [Mucilaginibacter sp. SP1R1]MBB6150904.1 ferric-dicitrate binding protein FerR (iron transport regulator) [Mucilaginibacter sp. SP1R1]